MCKSVASAELLPIYLRHMHLHSQAVNNGSGSIPGFRLTVYTDLYYTGRDH